MRHLAIFAIALSFVLSPLSVAPAFAENDRYEIEVRKAEAVHRAFKEKREARLKKKAERQRGYEERDDDWGGWPAWFGYDWDDDRPYAKRHGKRDRDWPRAWHVKHERHGYEWVDPYDPSPWFADDDDDYDDYDDDDYDDDRYERD